MEPTLPTFEEADALEQRIGVAPSDDGTDAEEAWGNEEFSGNDVAEANEADVLEQLREVPLDDEYPDADR